LCVDADVWRTPAWRCHPLINSITLVLSRDGIETFLSHTGHNPRILELPKSSFLLTI
jgi:Ala-tRNA(Pro) deacylase